MFYVLFCTFQNKTEKGGSDQLCQRLLICQVMDWHLTIGLSKVETSDAQIISVGLVGAVIWLEWAQEKMRGEELDTE